MILGSGSIVFTRSAPIRAKRVTKKHSVNPCQQSTGSAEHPRRAEGRQRRAQLLPRDRGRAELPPRGRVPPIGFHAQKAPACYRRPRWTGTSSSRMRRPTPGPSRNKRRRRDDRSRRVSKPDLPSFLTQNNPLVVSSEHIFAYHKFVMTIAAFKRLPQSSRSVAPTGRCRMINDGIESVSVWNAIFPGSLVTTIVVCADLVGDGVRDRLDPRVGAARSRST